ncbi:MAG: hypothetical protein IV093_06310 [Rubrivivax sp.]|nr:hypothetical protein [Rubrivivax sp.]
MRHRPLIWGVLLGLPLAAHAQEPSAREQMQHKLNQEVMAAPFNPGDIQKAQREAEAAKRQNLPPVMQPPAYWLPGWTCANLTTYRYYVYSAYRDCVYHHHYHGRYWR